VDSPTEFEASLRAALATRDPEPMRRYLSPGVRWGDEGHPRTCHGPDEVIETMRDALNGDLTATIDGVEFGSRGVMAHVTVRRPGEAPFDLYQVYESDAGLIVEIRAHFDEASARAAAGLGDGR
jgi:SnoaL-like protein